MKACDKLFSSFARGLGGDLVTTGARHLISRRQGLALIFGETPTKHINNRRTPTSMVDVQGSGSICCGAVPAACFAASAPHLYLDLLAPETFSLLSLVLFLSNSTAFDLVLHVRDTIKETSLDNQSSPSYYLEQVREKSIITQAE
jgi:hypothetical protein